MPTVGFEPTISQLPHGCALCIHISGRTVTLTTGPRVTGYEGCTVLWVTYSIEKGRSHTSIHNNTTGICFILSKTKNTQYQQVQHATSMNKTLYVIMWCVNVYMVFEHPWNNFLIKVPSWCFSVDAMFTTPETGYVYWICLVCICSIDLPFKIQAKCIVWYLLFTSLIKSLKRFFKGSALCIGKQWVIVSTCF